MGDLAKALRQAPDPDVGGKLDRLDADDQAEIARCRHERHMTYPRIIELLAANGVDTSETTLRRWLAKQKPAP